MSEQTPRRRRTREYYSPEEFIPYPAADSFDAMPPDIPFDMPPDTPSAPPKRKFRLPPLGESLRRTMQLLRSARPDFPFRRPHGVGDLLNMLQDVLLWLPKLTVHLALYACRYLRASVRYAVEGATPLWQAFLLRPYSWAGFYLLLGGLAFGGVHLMSRGSTGASFAGFVLLLAPLAQVGRWCAPTLGASTMMETAGPVMLLLSSVLLLYFRKKYHSILREGRV